MAVILALGAAFTNALTSVLQRSAAEDAPRDAEFRFRLIAFLVRRPVWLAGMGTMIAGFVLQAVALRFGRLSTVQPLLATEMVFLLLVMWTWFDVPLRLTDWASGAAIVVGLGVFLAIAVPTGGQVPPGAGTWIPAGVAGLAAAALAAAVALFVARGPTAKATWFGSSAAIAFAFAAAVIKEASDFESRHGWAALFRSWPPYAIAVVGLVGLFLAQNSFHAGPVSASQSALTIVDPLASILIGVSVFNEHIRAAGWQVAVEAVALIVMVVGVLTLTRSAVVTEARFDDPFHGAEPSPAPERAS